MKQLFLLLALIGTVPINLFAQIPYTLKLVPDEVRENDAFGDAVALSGNYLIVGAFLDNNEQGEKAGAAYIFHWNGQAWVQQAKLVGDGVDAGDRFGEAVALSGEYAIVGPVTENEPGLAYVYKREGETWVQQAKLAADDLPANESFGRPLRILDDYAFVGARTVRIFKREEETWTDQARLTTEAGEDLHLRAVSGDELIASRSFLNAEGTRSVQEVYVFEHETWTQQARLTGSDAGRSDWYQINVALSGDYLAIGSGESSTSDVIYMFKRGSQGWEYQTDFTSQDAASLQFKITNMAMSGDHLLVGTSSQETIGESSGAAYLFIRDGDTWIEQAKLIPDDNEAGARFGSSVALGDDHIIVGQDGHMVGDAVATGFGSAYVYALPAVVATSVETARMSFEYDISAPYPNPFSTQTTFALSVGQRQHVKIGLYDMLGRSIMQLHEGMLGGDTPHHFTFQPDDMPSGMYLIRVSSERGMATRPVYLLN